jgi:uncharacterized protein (TIGR00369 family)
MENTRTTTWDDPLEIAAEAREMSGLEFMRKLIIDQRRVPIGMTLGFRLVEVCEGEAVFEAEAGPWAYNPIGSVHGGYIATLLDSALGCAVHTMLEHGYGYTTLELKVNYVRPLTDKTGPVRAEAHVVNVSRQVGVAQGRLVDAAGRMYAWGSTTCLIFPLPAKAP